MTRSPDLVGLSFGNKVELSTVLVNDFDLRMKCLDEVIFEEGAVTVVPPGEREKLVSDRFPHHF